MGFNCGIVGLPNVGKSTLFNALTETASAEAANYPFCTIEPNVGRVPVPDERLNQISGISQSAKKIPTFLEFVDIAGLVRGASKGEGLGNKFLANIREVDAVVMVLRCFDDENISHVEGSIDPVRDAETVMTELLLADLESMERRLDSIEKRARQREKEAERQLAVIEAVLAVLREGKPARIAEISRGERMIFRQLNLLTAKPVLYACNVEEESVAMDNAYSDAVAEMAAAEGSEAVVISAAIEAEVAQLGDSKEKIEYLETLGLPEPGLDRMIHAGYRLLNLITFFTSGPKESRAWTIPFGTVAASAAGRIHTDFERGFIAAETISYEDFVSCDGEQGAKDAGKMHLEGRDYIVQDADVILFRFNV